MFSLVIELFVSAMFQEKDSSDFFVMTGFLAYFLLLRFVKLPLKSLVLDEIPFLLQKLQVAEKKAK